GREQGRQGEQVHAPAANEKPAPARTKRQRQPGGAVPATGSVRGLSPSPAITRSIFPRATSGTVGLGFLPFVGFPTNPQGQSVGVVPPAPHFPWRVDRITWIGLPGGPSCPAPTGSSSPWESRSPCPSRPTRRRMRH